MRRLVHYLSRGLSIAGGLVILYGCFSIFTRAIFRFQSLWSNDLLLMVFVSVLWLYCIQVVIQGRETTMETVPDAFQGRKKQVYQGILDLISCLCCLLLCVSGIGALMGLVELDLNVSSVLPIPQWVPVLCFIVAMLGCGGAFFYRAINHFRMKKGDEADRSFRQAESSCQESQECSPLP